MRFKPILTNGLHWLIASLAHLRRYLALGVSSIYTPSEDAPFAEYVKAHMDEEAYLAANPDVREAGVDPVRHWLRHGMAEGRRFFPAATVLTGDDAGTAEGNGWVHFTWRRLPVAIRLTIQPEDLSFVEFVKQHMDRQAYLEAYPDIRAAGVDPVDHWLEHGIVEGRRLYPGAIVFFGDDAKRVDSPNWQRFTFRGEAVAVHTPRPIAKSVLTQIIAQAEHDPAILAAGALALGQLRQRDGPDLLGNGGPDVRSILAAIPERPDIVCMIPLLAVGGAEKFAADLMMSLTALTRPKILVLVTEDTAETTRGWESHPILAPLRSVPVVFWRDACGPTHRNPRWVARLLNALRPEKVIVINSRIGNDMVARFGRGLSQFAKLYCAYFSLGIQGLAAPAGTRYPSLTMPFSLALTDNSPTAATLKKQWGELPGPGIAVLPPLMQPAESDVFLTRLQAHEMRAERTTRSRRWVWISRIEHFKGTAILATLAHMRPNDRYDLFGPAEGDLEMLGLALPNITYRGILPDVSSTDFTEYDGFLFTSLFEGMPNIALEMSQHAIPLVLADVGGLRDTFDDASAFFVSHGKDSATSAKAFAAALDRVAKLTPMEVRATAEAARAQALARHAPAVHRRHVAEIFEVHVDHD